MVCRNHPIIFDLLKICHNRYLGTVSYALVCRHAYRLPLFLARCCSMIMSMRRVKKMVTAAAVLPEPCLSTSPKIYILRLFTKPRIDQRCVELCHSRTNGNSPTITRVRGFTALQIGVSALRARVAGRDPTEELLLSNAATTGANWSAAALIAFTVREPSVVEHFLRRQTLLSTSPAVNG